MSFYEGLQADLTKGGRERRPLLVRLFLALVGFSERVQRIFRR